MSITSHLVRWFPILGFLLGGSPWLVSARYEPLINGTHESDLLTRHIIHESNPWWDMSQDTWDDEIIPHWTNDKLPTDWLPDCQVNADRLPIRSLQT